MGFTVAICGLPCGGLSSRKLPSSAVIVSLTTITLPILSLIAAAITGAPMEGRYVA